MSSKTAEASLDARDKLFNHPNSGIYTDSFVEPGLQYMVNAADRLLDMNKSEPIGAIVGDDVSGRAPTLVLHQFIRMAQMAGRTETVPRTFFMSGGKVSGNISLIKDDSDFKKYKAQERIYSQWGENMRTRAGQIVGATTLNNVVIVTEIEGMGATIARMSNAFEANGVNARPLITGYGAYLGGLDNPKTAARSALGVEKSPPMATSGRHPEFDAERVKQLREYLGTYSEAVFEELFGEPAPSLVGYQPKYPASVK